MRTPLCDLLGIDAPVIQAAIGPWSNAELTAAVSDAGGLGSLGSSLLSTDRVRADIARVRELTPKPFALNLTARPFSEEVFSLALEECPRVISFAIGSSRELVYRSHEAGCLFMQQVHTVRQAVDAAGAGADVIIAQGGEAGGFGGTVSTMALVPQVVDAISPVPVVAAGGIADGRGLAAALVLGAQGVNLGTRFLACREAGIDPSWQEAIAAAESEDAVKVEFAAAVFPPASPGGFRTLPRSLRTPWIEQWNAASAEELESVSGRLSEELIAAVKEGRGHELVPFTGQSVGLVRNVPSAAEIVRDIVAGAAEALGAAERSERAAK